MLLGTLASPEVGTFRAMFPEFRTCPDSFCQSYLDMAAKRLSASVLLDAYDEAHGNLAAHMITTSPAGISSRVVRDDGNTCYFDRVEEIFKAYCHCVTVT